MGEVYLNKYWYQNKVCQALVLQKINPFFTFKGQTQKSFGPYFHSIMALECAKGVNFYALYDVSVPSSTSSGLTLCMLSNFACLFCHLILFFFFSKNFFFNRIFQENHQNVKQLGSRSGPTFCRARSGSKLFAKIVSRQLLSSLPGKALTLKAPRNNASEKWRLLKSSAANNCLTLLISV